MKVNNKYYPNSVNLKIGYVFYRLPYYTMFRILPEYINLHCYPLYGRLITDIAVISPHKALVTLEDIVDETEIYPGTTPISVVEIVIYGELSLLGLT